LSLAHFLVDTYSSMLGALLPFLMEYHGISFTQAGFLGGALVLSGSLMQPVYGYLADHFQHKFFVILSPAVAGVFISALGLAPDFNSLVVLVLLGGTGIAAFHPQATAVVVEAKKERPGVQLSIFIAAGTLGFALGPFLITSVVTMFGLGKTFWVAGPGVVCSLYLIRHGFASTRIRRETPRFQVLRHLRHKARPILTLFALVVIRSAVQVVFVSFLPVFLTLRGYSGYQAGQILSLFLFMGALAGLTGGFLSDRFGGKSVIVLSMVSSVPLLLLFLLSEGLPSICFCLAGSFALYLTLPVNVAMAQRMVPEGASTVSALLMGFAWGIGGATLPLIGVMSDTFGLQGTLILLVLFCIPGIPLAVSLPGTMVNRSEARS
jgi:FSR family fosmidomycin resistance protein-like MFS transporter